MTTPPVYHINMRYGHANIIPIGYQYTLSDLLSLSSYLTVCQCPRKTFDPFQVCFHADMPPEPQHTIDDKISTLHAL